LWCPEEAKILCAKTLLHTIIFWAVSVIFLVLVGFGTVAFVTLLERKLLGLSQTRLGPNKVTLLGILQPLADGLKLLIKQLVLASFSQPKLFYFRPIFLLILFLLSWVFILPWNGRGILLKCPSLFFFSLLGVGAYGVIISGWRITRGFSKLGALRRILQRLSFEVALIVVFLFVLRFLKRFFFRRTLVRIEVFFIWRTLWLTISLIESNRAPFDLLEGERELIRGFNVEIGSSVFVLLFLREYGILTVLALLIRVILRGGVRVFGLIFVIIILFVRRCFPRIRYDSLIGLIWQSVLSIRVLSLIISTVYY